MKVGVTEQRYVARTFAKPWIITSTQHCKPASRYTRLSRRPNTDVTTSSSSIISGVEDTGCLSKNESSLPTTSVKEQVLDRVSIATEVDDNAQLKTVNSSSIRLKPQKDEPLLQRDAQSDSAASEKMTEIIPKKHIDSRSQKTSTTSKHEKNKNTKANLRHSLQSESKEDELNTEKFKSAAQITSATMKDKDVSENAVVLQTRKRGKRRLEQLKNVTPVPYSIRTRTSKSSDKDNITNKNRCPARVKEKQSTNSEKDTQIKCKGKQATSLVSDGVIKHKLQTETEVEAEEKGKETANKNQVQKASRPKRYIDAEDKLDWQASTKIFKAESTVHTRRSCSSTLQRENLVNKDDEVVRTGIFAKKQNAKVNQAGNDGNKEESEGGVGIKRIRTAKQKSENAAKKHIERKITRRTSQKSQPGEQAKEKESEQKHKPPKRHLRSRSEQTLTITEKNKSESIKLSSEHKDVKDKDSDIETSARKHEDKLERVSGISDMPSTLPKTHATKYDNDTPLESQVGSKTANQLDAINNEEKEEVTKQKISSQEHSILAKQQHSSRETTEEPPIGEQQKQNGSWQKEAE